jgi:phospholipase/carboxylesterase
MSKDLYIFREEPGATDGAPLFFLFHGTGGNENQLVSLGRELLPQAHIVSPRGAVSEGGALRFFRRTGEGVYDMDDLARATAKMTAFVRAHAAGKGQRTVVGLGYSNGANILASVLFEVPELFDAAVLMHPLIPFGPQPQPGLVGKRILITAGRRDPICPPAASEALAKYFEQQGADAKLFWHPGGHEVAQAEIDAVGAFLQRI